MAEMKQLVADAESYLHVGVDEAGGGGGHNNTDTESVTSATARYEGQGCQLAKFDPFLYLDFARSEGMGAQSPHPPPWHNQRKGRDQILPTGNREEKPFLCKGLLSFPAHTSLTFSDGGGAGN